MHLVSQVYYVALVVGQTVKVFIGSILGLISYQTCGDHLLKPLGLRLVIKVDAAHQIVSCYKEYKKKTWNTDCKNVSANFVSYFLQ